MQEKTKLRIRAISDIMGNPEVGIIVLTDNQRQRQIAVVCDRLVKQELSLRLAKKQECNTMLPEVLTQILTGQYGFRPEVVINDIVDGIYRAMIVNTDTGQPMSVRAADGILLHVIARVPLYATLDIMRKQSVPLLPNSPAMSLPYNALSENMLRSAMQSAVSTEHYEAASLIRDELRKRGKL